MAKGGPSTGFETMMVELGLQSWWVEFGFSVKEREKIGISEFNLNPNNKK